MVSDRPRAALAAYGRESMTFAKWTRPHSADDAETWSESDLAPTLNGWEERHEVPPVLALVFNPHRSMLGPGEWEENFKPDTIHDSLTANPAPKGPPLILSTADSPARTSAWPVNGPVLGAPAAVYGLSSPASCATCGQPGFVRKMSLDFYPALTDVTSGRSSAIWMNSGMAWRGRYSTRAISESRNAADACSLSAVLETRTLPQRYWLSAKAAAGILRRAAKRGKELPPTLLTALMELASNYQ